MFIFIVTHRSFIRTHATTMASESTIAPESVSVSVPVSAGSSPDYWPMTASAANTWDLSYIKDSNCTSILRDGLLAVVRAGESPAVKQKEINVWEYLSKYSPPEGRGFMFSAGDDWVVTLVQNQMETGHSGSSMGWVMRNIEFIAKNGLTAHREKFP